MTHKSQDLGDDRRETALAAGRRLVIRLSECPQTQGSRQPACVQLILRFLSECELLAVFMCGWGRIFGQFKPLSGILGTAPAGTNMTNCYAGRVPFS